jgi:hypothetical protein
LGDASVRGLRGALRRQTLTQSILHRGLPGRRCAGYSGSPAASSARKILRPLRWRTHTPSPDCVVSFRARPDPNKLANSLQAECHRGDSTICFQPLPSSSLIPGWNFRKLLIKSRAKKNLRSFLKPSRDAPESQNT